MENKVGRPRKDIKNKKDAPIFVNLTKTQKRQLDIIASQEDISLSRVCLNALRLAGYIK